MQTFNIQPVEKQVGGDGESLDVHSVFLTIQGEGPFAGQRAVFIRLAGCNLQCPLCDTDYTDGREIRSVDSLVKSVREYLPPMEGNLVVITGGEPFRQNLSVVIECFVFMGYRVQIETNGTLFQEDLPYGTFTIVCSPKAGKVHPKLAPHINAYKYVLHGDQIDADGLPTLALNHSAAPRVARPHEGFAGPVYVQPVDTKDEWQNERHLKATVQSVMKHGYTLGLQIHKIINVE